MTGIIWTDNDGGRLAHVGASRFEGIYLGYVANYGDGKGWRYEVMFARPFGERERFVSSRAVAMKAIRRRWQAFMRRGGLVYRGERCEESAGA
jgi:hypothetical protein